ncbi:MAG: VOC family protein [Pseudobdellovibrionaceae bacterium]
MKLDHVVVHIDNNENILKSLKKTIDPMGFPFEPKWGKGTKGFKAANIWIGRQYFEIIRLLRTDGGGWTDKWVRRYNNGKRGAFCLFLQVENIDVVAKDLISRGIGISGPERISFKTMFGLIKKTLPWQIIYLPEIPGTDLEIGFIQYDPDPNDRIKQYLVPNSDSNGIDGFSSATVQLPLNDSAKAFLQKLFPVGQLKENSVIVQLQNGELEFLNFPRVQIQLKGDVSNPKVKGLSFQLENVTFLT